MLNKDKKAIEGRVNKLNNFINEVEKANQLDELDFKIIVKKINPSDIPNFSKYPYDYQYFVQTIGGVLTLNVGSYFALGMIKPEPIHECTSWGDEHNELSLIWAAFPSSCLLVASYPCDEETIAFNTKTNPYTVMYGSWKDETLLQKNAFLDFIEYQFSFLH